jgi:hypothetical protein
MEENKNEEITREQIVRELEDELIMKSMRDINTFQCCDNELYLRGKDEYGKEFQVCFDAFNFLEWIDEEHISYIKNELIRYLKNK